MISKGTFKDKIAKPLNLLKLPHDQKSGNIFYKGCQKRFEDLQANDLNIYTGDIVNNSSK